ncbi:MAG: (4Fe-4S)-binding protein, partial [Solirubrobacteraceae bacterium]
RYEAAQRALLLGRAPLGSSHLTRALPGPISGWTAARELPPVPEHSFRDWWATRSKEQVVE